MERFNKMISRERLCQIEREEEMRRQRLKEVLLFKNHHPMTVELLQEEVYQAMSEEQKEAWQERVWKQREARIQLHLDTRDEVEKAVDESWERFIP